MRLLDVNVLIYAHREDSTPDHEEYAEWLIDLVRSGEPFALSVLAVSGLVRIVTNPKIFRQPSPLDEVFEFLAELRRQPAARIVAPGPRHLDIWEELCRQAKATGKLVADAQHAAVAIENGCTMVSTDSDFGKFSNLEWEKPLGG